MEKYSNPLVMQPMPGIGDMLWFLPHVRALADGFSLDKSLTLLVRPSTHASTLLESEPCIKDVIPLYRCQMNRQGKVREANHKEGYRHDGVFGTIRLAKELRAYGFDAAWILDRRAYYVYASMIAGIPHRFGLGFGLERILLNRPMLPKKYHKTHARDRCTKWLKGFGIDVGDYEYPLKVTLKATKKVYKNFKKESPWVCVGIGASEVERKWSKESFRQLVRDLSDVGLTVFICGGEKERTEAEAIQQGLCHVHCVTDWTVMETAALVTESDFYVGNDTFLYNLAALQGKKSCAIGGNVPVPTYLKTMREISAGNDIHQVTPQMVLEFLKTQVFF